MAKNKIARATLQEPFIMVYNYMLESNILTDNELKLYLILLKYADSKSQCFPSLNTIAQNMNKKKRQVQYLIQGLQDKGFLRVENRKTENGDFTSNLYTIFTDKELFLPDKKKSPEEATDQSNTSQSSNNNLSADSILPTGGKSQDTKAFSRDMLNEIYDFDILVENNKTTVESVDSIMELLLDVLNSNAETIRVNKEDKAAVIVKGRLLKLNYMHIQYVLDEVGKQANLIKNKRAYLITSLYNSYTTLETHVTNKVNHHMQE